MSIEQTTEFKLEYSGQELSSTVTREGNIFHLHVDNNIDADLELKEDGSLVQISGPELPLSSVDYIRKRVLGHDATGSSLNNDQPSA
ncbi:hypothetical protein [Mucilaginibacter ginkgonis]|uniref:Uncharacterized protein n=1 Tax=Mucilaginibacter ginkgonis TaxID=2682091 RepID=A0A6I4HXT0_9SPHI|nr:hypothetical protein [Mucilaginibacter ginkgonis]QQL49266.1 hypothetical protein GO620_013955 [Mucilaginibacter ginkgonis]